ncbi:MAG TPA: outer membrane lipoprotein carrier protein LolA, partial [Syntrophorhabdaceae bacterium]|nr:outer membrane lipoprotein carrier protein LolA [Syntrophorhabdaceae bacterium]
SVLIAAVLLMLPVFSGAAGFDSLKKTYAGINSLEARFHQKLFMENVKKEREFDGEFLYKRGKGFLWRYTKPKGKYFLYDGQFIWQDEEEKNFVTKQKVDKQKTGGTFFDLIDDISKLDDLFTLKQESIAGDMTVMELVPKKDATITVAKMWIDKQNVIRKIQTTEFSGNINTIEFSAVRINQAISDAKFIYSPDKKKEIVEQ